jgi:hypothetical protein
MNLKKAKFMTVNSFKWKYKLSNVCSKELRHQQVKYYAYYMHKVNKLADQ